MQLGTLQNFLTTDHWCSSLHDKKLNFLRDIFSVKLLLEVNQERPTFTLVTLISVLEIIFQFKRKSSNLFFFHQNNVWCNKNRIIGSSKTLMCLVRFLLHQMLAESKRPLKSLTNKNVSKNSHYWILVEIIFERWIIVSV